MGINDVLNRLTLDQLLRYAYGGGLLIFFAYIFRPYEVGRMIESMGVIFAPLFILGLGIVVYVISRGLLCEYVTSPIVHTFHFIWDKMREILSKDDKITSPTGYLYELGIKGFWKYFKRREAYTSIRRLFNFNQPQHKKLRKHFDNAHSTHHVLWITIYMLMLVGFIMWRTGLEPKLFSTIFNPLYLVFLIIFLFCSAIVSEIHQFQYECRIIKTYNTMESGERITVFLREYGFINTPKEKK